MDIHMMTPLRDGVGEDRRRNHILLLQNGFAVDLVGNLPAVSEEEGNA